MTMNLDNATPEFLADELGEIRDKQKTLKKQEGFIKAALKARVDDDTISVTGEFYTALFSDLERTGLNTAKIKAEHNEAWIIENSTTTPYSQIKTVKVK